MFSLFQEPEACRIRDPANVSNTNARDLGEVWRIEHNSRVSTTIDHRLELNDALDKGVSSTPKSSPNGAWCQLVKELKDKDQISIPKTDCKALNLYQRIEKKENTSEENTNNKQQRVRFAGVHKNADKRTRVKRTKNALPWLKDVHWSRKEVEKMKQQAAKNATFFRAGNISTVHLVERLFDDFCKTNSEDIDCPQEVDEEAEEMLNYFLRDWSASDGRGLEEMVATRNVFQEGRMMAVESILAYQQILRNNGLSSDEVSLRLRARSESASRRARMFALYLALGDALALSFADN